MQPTIRSFFIIFACIGLGLLCSCRSEVFSSTSLPTSKYYPTSTRHPTPDVGDGGVLSGEPCGPPCLWNITPDITTEQQVIEILEKHFIKSDCDSPWPASEQNPWIVCGPIGVEIGEGGKVVNLEIKPVQPITVGDFLGSYGEPDAVHLDGDGPGGFNTPAEWVFMDLFFDKIRTEVHLPRQDGTTFVLEPSTLIDAITYPGSVWTNRVSNVAPWAGYGEYQGPIWAGP
jgi:hypothetical protein